MKRHCLFFFLLFCVLIPLGATGKPSHDTDSACVHQLLLYLQEHQSDGSGYFPEGLFPSYRQYVYRPGVLKDDDNMFFTALIVQTLNRIYPQLSAPDQTIVRNIRVKASPAFELFRNKHGRPTYNFWRVHPPKIFPNGGWMNWFNRSQSLPDDFDDTAIGLLAMQTDTATAQQAHQCMQQFTNLRKQRIKNTYKRYRSFPAYSVWFGEYMPIDFDICTLANVLSFVSAYQIPWTAVDSASLNLIEAMISNGDYLQHPAYISPHYQTVSIILYHLSLLMSINHHVLLPYKNKLITAAQQQLQQSDNTIEQLMLITALKRWGVNRPVSTFLQDCSEAIREYTSSDFVYFIANMPSMLPNPLKSILSASAIGQFNYYCPSYNVALALEYKLTR